MWIAALAVLASPAAPDLCKERKPCAVAETSAAGTVGRRPLSVVHLKMHEPAFPPREGACPQEEYWLVDGDGTNGKAAPRVLLQICNDGYGAAGMGEDMVEVSPNRFVHSRSGGSNWRWTATKSLALAPLRLEGVSGTSWWTARPEYESKYSHDLLTLAGKAHETVPLCGPDGLSPPEGEEELPTVTASWAPLPAVSAPGSYARTGWKTTALGTCGAPVDGARAGFLVHGAKTADPADASMTVARFGDRWIVEIRDDIAVLEAKSWVAEDHLEVWAAETASSTDCIDPKRKAVQWAVRLTDGKVIPAEGKPAATELKAEVVRIDGRVRVALDMPRDRWLTVVFSDSDDGRKQERLVATSAVEFGKAFSVGRADGPAVACEEKGGALHLLPVALPAEGPVLRDD